MTRQRGGDPGSETSPFKSLMTEDEVNRVVAIWLRSQGRSFEGILTKGRDVPAPSGDVFVNLDFFSPRPIPWWIESKGENVRSDGVLSAMGKLALCVYYSNGNAGAILAAPSSVVDWVLEHRGFFELVFAQAFNQRKAIGLFDAQRRELTWL